MGLLNAFNEWRETRYANHVEKMSISKNALIVVERDFNILLVKNICLWTTMPTTVQAVMAAVSMIYGKVTKLNDIPPEFI